MSGKRKGKQIVVGDGKSGPPYPEDRWPDARIEESSLLAAIRRLQERMEKLVPQITDAVDARLDENALSTIRSEISDLSESVASMAEDVAKISLIEAEVRSINRKLEDWSP